jgi:hypothetical protein
LYHLYKLEAYNFAFESKYIYESIEAFFRED